VGQAEAIVIHTTGGGITARYRREGAREGDATPLQTAMRVYATIMEASPHYVVGQCGSVGQVAPEDLCAWHVGGAGSAPYHRLGTSWIPSWQRARYEWWQRRWEGVDGPAELAGGRLWAPYVVPPTLGQRIRHPLSWGRGSANARSIGIEVVPPLAAARGPWSAECWRSVATLVCDISMRRSITLERTRVITHSDAHPLSRTTPRGEPWDTVEEQWSWERFEERAGWSVGQ